LEEILKKNSDILKQLPLPPPMPAVPVVTPPPPQSKDILNQLIYNEMVQFKDTINDLVLINLPNAVTYYLADHQYVDDTNELLKTLPTSVKEIFEIRFMEEFMVKLGEIKLVSNDARQSIKNRVMSELLPFYMNVCELAFNGLKSMIDNYFEYLASEIQFIGIYNLLLKH
jgi:hypothetical protein